MDELYKKILRNFSAVTVLELGGMVLLELRGVILLELGGEVLLELNTWAVL